VSKWENETTMPDITYLPKISEFFQVSVDELLGLKPLRNNEYIPKLSDTKEYWNNKSDYLHKVREFFWNDDYMQFLVDNVWKINKPVNVIDFGCGYGYLAMKLLPMLPDGSTYTGIDINENLINEAKAAFESSNYKTEFLVCDAYNYKTDRKYDIAICQAFLRHLSQPQKMLRKMVDALLQDGLLICIEVNRRFENNGLYIKGMDYNSLCFDFNKFWESELNSEGRDYSIGMKIPFYMQELGLHDIDIRLNDKVNFINPGADKNKYDNEMDSLLKAHGWHETASEKKKEKMISFYMNRGFNRAEGEKYIKTQTDISQYLTENKEQAFVIKSLCLLISYGRK
jgi:ubiquinone/menaquinone biosynthesis C-methylase UbiE